MCSVTRGNRDRSNRPASLKRPAAAQIPMQELWKRKNYLFHDCTKSHSSLFVCPPLAPHRPNESESIRINAYQVSKKMFRANGFHRKSGASSKSILPKAPDRRWPIRPILRHTIILLTIFKLVKYTPSSRRANHFELYPDLYPLYRIKRIKKKVKIPKLWDSFELLKVSKFKPFDFNFLDFNTLKNSL